MTNKGAESSSAFVVISRKALALSMAGCCLISFAAGYIWGYEGSSSSKLISHVDADSKKIISEEKTVLDSSGKTSASNPISVPGAIPKELIPRPSAPEAVSVKSGTKANTKTQPNQNELEKSNERERRKSDNKLEPAMSQNPQTPAENNKKERQVLEKSGEKINISGQSKRQKTPGTRRSYKKGDENRGAKKMYSVQVGSFIDSQKAARLKEDLHGRGFTAHIVTSKSSHGKMFSKVRIGVYRFKSDAEEIMPKLRAMGLDCIVVPASKQQ